MNMRMTVILFAACAMLALGTGPGLAVDTTPLASQKTTPKKAAPKKVPSDENLEVLKEKLDIVGKKLVQDAAKNVTPSIRAKAVAPEDKEFVARYVEVDVPSMTTEVRPASGAGGKYIGVIKYLENYYECRGKSKDDALKAPCTMVKSRRMNELIRYEGKWIY